MDKNKTLIRNRSKKRKILLGVSIVVGATGITIGTATPLTSCSKPDHDGNKVDLPSDISAIAPTLEVNYDPNNNQTSTNAFSIVGDLPTDYTGIPYYTIHDASQRLFVDPNNHLVVKAHANAGNIIYKFDITFPSDNKYKSKEVKNIDGNTVIISKINLPTFNVTIGGWSGATNYGYSNLTATLSNTAISDYTGPVSYEITQNITDNKLSISGSTLTLATGLAANTYSFKIKAVAAGDANYNGADSQELVGSITIGKANLPTFTASVGSWSGATTYGYAQLTADLSNNLNTVAPNYSGPVSYEITQNITDDKLSISGSTLTLATGLAANTYSFKIKAVAAGDANYNGADSQELDGSITIGKANLPTFTASVSSWSGATTYGYAQVTADLSNNLNTVAPNYGGPVSYEITQNITDDKLSISGSTLTLATGLAANTYSFKIKAVAAGDANYNGADSQELDGSITIGKANLPTFTASVGSWSGATTYGYAQLTADLSNNLNTVAPNYSGPVSYEITQNITDDKLSISGSTLTLATGLAANTYSFKIKAVAAGDANYNGADSQELDGSITIGKANLPTFTASVSSWSGATTYGYAQVTADLSNNLNTVAPNYGGPVSYEITQNITDDKLSISGSTLTLATGLAANTYSFKIKAVAAGDANYNGADSQELDGSITIGKANLPDFDIINPLDTDLNVGYGQQTKTLSTDLDGPNGTSIEYIITSSNTSGKLTIDGTTLELASGLTQNVYTYTIQATATNPNYNDKVVSTTYSLYINDLISPSAMTGDSWNGYITSCGDNKQYDNGAYRLFDDDLGDPNSHWTNITNNGTGWIQIILPVAKTIRSYSFDSLGTIGNNYNSTTPKNWILKGSNNGSSWTNLRTTDTFDVTGSTVQTFTSTIISDNTTSYTHYQMDVTVNNGSTSYVAMRELRLFGC